MLTNAFALSLITTGAFFAVYKKLPKKMRKWIEEHALLADAFALFLTYLLLGGTLTALTAGAMVGLMTSGLLHIAQNPEKFQYMIAIKEVAADTITGIGNTLNDWAKGFLANRKPKMELVAA